MVWYCASCHPQDPVLFLPLRFRVFHRMMVDTLLKGLFPYSDTRYDMKQLLGTRDFYKRALVVAIPIMIQNGITNFVNMLDNIMIGRIGTDQMSGVSIVNQLLFVWFLCVFGGLAGIGIFTSQFHGKGDENGVRYTMRLMLYGALILIVAGSIIFLTGGDALIRMYLKGEAAGTDPEATLSYAKQYLSVMRFCFVPFAVTQVYYSTLRATGETMLPMRSGLISVFVNLAGNYILIYGKLGAPALGVTGAAIATVLSRVTEMCYVGFSTHRSGARFPFATGVWRPMRIPSDLVFRCTGKATPLLFNELLWAGGQAVLMHSYSLRGLSVVASFNIANAINNVFNISFIAMGNAIGILIGQTLGAGKLKEAKRDAGKYILFSVGICVGVGLLMLPFASVFPLIYNTTTEVRGIATDLIRIYAVLMPVFAFANASFFILRSGGKTFITFLFDSFFCWICTIPLAYALVYLTVLPVQTIFFAVQATEILKSMIGFFMIRKGIWIHDITVYENT